MAVISTDTDARYWKVVDSDQRDDGSFDIRAVQIADYQGTRLSVRPAPERIVTRPQSVPVGTIIKITDVTTVDRTFTVNPTS